MENQGHGEEEEVRISLVKAVGLKIEYEVPVRTNSGANACLLSDVSV